MKQLLTGFALAILCTVILGAGMIGDGSTGTYHAVQEFAPSSFAVYSSHKPLINIPTTGKLKARFKPTAAVNLYLDNVAGSPYPLAANTEHTIGIRPERYFLVFSVTSSARTAKTKINIQWQ